MPISLARIAALPLQRRIWERNNLDEFQILPDETSAILPGAITIPKKPCALRKRTAPIFWPSDLELQVVT